LQRIEIIYVDDLFTQHWDRLNFFMRDYSKITNTAKGEENFPLQSVFF